MISHIKAILEKDPAASILELVLYPSLYSIFFHRVANILWKLRIPFFPRFISQLSRFLTGIEIHPGASIGKGFFIDHGMGVVIGETAIIGNNVTLFQGVTLGGTGKEKGKRHPTLGNDIVVGSGAKILGNIKIGNGSYVGANSVVLGEVPPHSTVVGVPGRVVRIKGQYVPNISFNHAKLPDPLASRLKKIQAELSELEVQAGLWKKKSRRK
ncbi:MAG: serine O-acetyltransferase [Candidatus Firestonebacteria bacterium]|nr:serine O-acetyltransferase [Candidatus Firestonebacteria bacterium]